MLDLKQDIYEWHVPNDVELILKLQAANGLLIDYVDIKIDQSSDNHSAEIISGGIGQDFVEIKVKALSTFWFKYEARGYVTQTAGLGVEMTTVKN